MMRTVLALAVGIALLPAVAGCEESDPEDEKMTQRRDAPANTRAAPGSGLGLSSEGEGTGEESDEEPAGGGDD